MGSQTVQNLAKRFLPIKKAGRFLVSEITQLGRVGSPKVTLSETYFIRSVSLDGRK